ncbi:MAG: alcohol dehydrogenase class IV [Candidatus Poriferisodalaceae bacterium]|jgi:alcohol dehydrogenase class IV
MTGVRNIRRAANEVVIAGRGAAANVSAVVERLGATSVTVVTTPSVAASPLLDRIVSAIGADKVTIFSQSRAHTPESTVLDATDAAVSADALVSLGGSSVVDLTKGVALVLAAGRDFDALRASGPWGSPTLPHIAIPTTLSAAEFTAAAGITNTERGVKEIYLGASLAPRTVILDGDLGEYTPRRLWAGTGMKLVADCIEGMLSARATRFTDALLLEALQILLSDLGSHDDADARQRCLEAAHMTLSNLHNVGVGATAALRHQLGGGAGLPHGEASTIVLPHVLRWNGDAARPVLDRIAGRLGVGDANGLIVKIEQSIAALGLPARLSEVGIDASSLAAVAQHAASEASARRNVRPVDAAGLREILDSAY